jgi:hypothetical protein
LTPYLTAPIPGTGGTGVLMGEFDDDGRESLVLGFANNQWLTHFKVLGHGVVSWLTRGVSLGIYRNGFSIHSDDLFLPDARWSIAGHDRRGLRPGHLSADAGVQDPDEPADVAYLVAWQRRTGLKIDQAFNGFGSGDWSAQTGAPDPLLPAITAAKGSLRFIIPNLGPARTATGVKWPGADASRETVVRRVGSARTVPRHPMNSFDNVGTKADEVAEYNWIDTSRDDGGSGYCADHPATETCISPLDPVSGYDAYIVPIEKRIAFSHIVANDPMPHSAHQANLAEDRILYPVLDSILATYRRTFAASALLVNPRLTNAGAALARLQDRAGHNRRDRPARGPHRDRHQWLRGPRVCAGHRARWRHGSRSDRPVCRLHQRGGRSRPRRDGARHADGGYGIRQSGRSPQRDAAGDLGAGPAYDVECELCRAHRLTKDVAVFDLDWEDTRAAQVAGLRARGTHAICYFSAGSWENWRSDQAALPAAVKGRNLSGWKGEKWLDTRALATLLPIMGKRMDMCKAKGCESLDPDNVDG